MGFQERPRNYPVFKIFHGIKELRGFHGGSFLILRTEGREQAQAGQMETFPCFLVQKGESGENSIVSQHENILLALSNLGV